MPKDNPLGYLLPEYGVEAFPGYQQEGLQPDGSYRIHPRPEDYYRPDRTKVVTRSDPNYKEIMARMEEVRARGKQVAEKNRRLDQGAFTKGIANPAYEQPALPSNPQELAQHAMRFTSMQRALDQNGGQPLRYTDPVSGQVYLISRK